MSKFLDKFIAWLYIVIVNLGVLHMWFNVTKDDIELLAVYEPLTILGLILYSLAFGAAAVSASKAMYKVNIKNSVSKNANKD